MYPFFQKKTYALSFLIGTIIYLCFITFLILAFLSYSPTDNSWFYVSSDCIQCANACGYIGACIAATFFYLFGAVAWILFIPILYLLLVYLQERSLLCEWERFFASIYILLVIAAMCTIQGGDGGLVGLLFAQKLFYWFDPLGRMIFLQLSMIICAILLLQWSGMFLIQGVFACCAYCYQMMKHYRVMSTIMQAGVRCLHIIVVRLPRMFIAFIQSIFDGQAFDDTGLLFDEENILPNDDFLFFTKTSIKFYELSLKKVRKKAQLKEISYFTFVCVQQKNLKPLSVSVAKNEEIVAAKKTIRYILPQADIFIAEKSALQNDSLEKELQERAHLLQDKLKRFGVMGQVVAIKRGPVVTVFEYQPEIDIKLSKIVVLEDDLAMALQSMSVRIIAPIPGRAVVGFEVANSKRNDVLFSQVIASSHYVQFSGSLPLILGKDTIGEVVVVDLAKMPHLLIAGSTGSGKSVALNAILISLLCKLSPDELKLILIDPKRLEFAAFIDIAHLLFPIVTVPQHAHAVLRWVVQEMEERYEKMARLGAKNITDYNARIIHTNKNKSSNEQEQQLPFIVVMIDELADLMLTIGRDIEELITRITQMARAAGIHMIVATQRPSVDVITGLIKANFPSRISFRVASRIDSRTILDTIGADRLLGRGDMLFLDATSSTLKRVHSAYACDEEIERVADHIRSQRKVMYLDKYQEITKQAHDLHEADDVLYHNVRDYLGEIDEVSISLLQRKFRIGYNRSARIIDILESQGLIMPQDGSKTRKVIR